MTTTDELRPVIWAIDPWEDSFEQSAKVAKLLQVLGVGKAIVPLSVITSSDFEGKFPDAPISSREMIEHAQKRISKFLTAIELGELHPQIIFASKPISRKAGDAFIQFCQQTRASLLILSTSGKSEQKVSNLGSFAERFLS
jgi:hypothetical protein